MNIEEANGVVKDLVNVVGLHPGSEAAVVYYQELDSLKNKLEQAFVQMRTNGEGLTWGQQETLKKALNL